MAWLKNIFFFCFLLLTSCSVSKTDTVINIDKEYINSYIQCRVSPMGNAYKTNKPIYLELKYNSTNTIVIPYDYGLRVFEGTSDGWVEIEQKPIDRGGKEDIVLSTDQYLPAVHFVMVFPEISTTNQKHKLRIYIVGQMENNGISTNVAASTEIKVTP